MPTVMPGVGQLARSRTQIIPSAIRSATCMVDALKLVSFRSKGTSAGTANLGVVQGGNVCPISKSSARDMRELIEIHGHEKPSVELDIAAALPLKEVHLLAPLQQVGAIICVGKNYLEHVKEVDSSLPGISQVSVPEHPIIFTKAAGSLAAHMDTIKYPHGVTNELDYEGELGVVIGKGGINISRENAREHIFGYTIVNDVTARDIQKKHQQFAQTPQSGAGFGGLFQWYLGKSMDTFCPMGPWVVPAADVDIKKSLRIQTWVNGELRQDGQTKDMIFDIPTLISICSQGMSLHAGDIIATGTPSGVGAGFKPPKYLQPGDVVRIAIEGIGELQNCVE